MRNATRQQGAANRYRAGYTFERKVTEHLQSDGYWTVEARGSHGLADIVAVKPGQVLLIQAKGGHAGLTHLEWNALHTLATRLGAIALVADRPRRGAVRLRQITGQHAQRSRLWPCAPFSTDTVAST